MTTRTHAMHNTLLVCVALGPGIHRSRAIMQTSITHTHTKALVLVKLKIYFFRITPTSTATITASMHKNTQNNILLSLTFMLISL